MVPPLGLSRVGRRAVGRAGTESAGNWWEWQGVGVAFRASDGREALDKGLVKREMRVGDK